MGESVSACVGISKNPFLLVLGSKERSDLTFIWILRECMSYLH